jgi:hypothetical protein
VENWDCPLYSPMPKGLLVLIRVHLCSFVANIFNTLGIVSQISC